MLKTLLFCVKNIGVLFVVNRMVFVYGKAVLKVHFYDNFCETLNVYNFFISWSYFPRNVSKIWPSFVIFHFCAGITVCITMGLAIVTT